MKKWIRAGFRSVLEIATSAKKLVKGMYHPKNQRMVVIRFSIFDDLFIYIYIYNPEVSFSTRRRLPQQKKRLGFCYRMALPRALRSIDPPARSRKNVGLN